MRIDDSFGDMFERQEMFMNLLRQHGRLPDYPADLSTKAGQKIVKEMVWSLVEEMAEASYTLKNKGHRLTDVKEFDKAHYKEELVDALSFWMEICIFSGFTADEMYIEYCKKNRIVRERLENGY